MKMTYIKKAFYLATAIRTISGFNAKCKKLGFEPFKVEVLREWQERNREDGVIETWCEFEITGKIPKLNGWEVIAKIDHMDKSTMIRKFVDDIDLSQYRNDPVCEHCQIDRYRNVTFIVRNESGELKQVGSSCLKDFTGHDPRQALSAIGMIQDFQSEWDDFCSHGRGINGFYVHDVLARTIIWLKGHGYVSKSAAYDRGLEPTISVIESSYTGEPNLTVPKEEYPAIEKEVNAIIEHFKNHPEKGSNDYIGNCAEIAKSLYMDWKFGGYAVSMIPTYYREMEQKAKQDADSQSEYVGKVGERKEFELYFADWKCFETAYGVMQIYKLKDKNGNVFIWKTASGSLYDKNDIALTSNQLRMDTYENELIKLRGRIKEHKEYRGVKQTVLTRCTQIFEEIEETA